MILLFAMLLGVVRAPVQDPPASVTLPAFTAYTTPHPERPQITERGVRRWSNPADTLEWYGTIVTPGALTSVLNVDLPAGETVQYLLRVDKTSHTVTTTGGTGTTRVSFPPVTVERAGPLRIALSAKRSSGGTLGSPVSLELTGTALKGAHFNLTERRNAASVHLNYPVERGAKLVAFTNTIIAREDPLYTYYCACGFRRGYLGMQVNSPTERRVIFSIWDSGTEKQDRANVAAADRVTLLEKGEDVVASDFGNEGTGGHSHKIVDWRKGEPVSFLVTAKPEGSTTEYAGYYARSKGPWKLIARFRAPKDGNYLSGLYSFVENFGGSTGQVRRAAEFDSQFVYSAEGVSTPLTKATFSHDSHGRENRLDYFAKGEGTHFLLTNGGFGLEHLPYGTPLTHTPAKAPRVDPTSLLTIQK